MVNPDMHTSSSSRLSQILYVVPFLFFAFFFVFPPFPCTLRIYCVCIECTCVVVQEYGTGRFNKKHSTFFAKMMQELDLRREVEWCASDRVGQRALTLRCAQGQGLPDAGREFHVI